MATIIQKVKWTLERKIYLLTGLSLQGRFSLGKYFSLKTDLKEIQKQSNNSRISFPVTKLWACYEDKQEDSGTISGAYFHQDLFIAQQIFKNNPTRHVDIGSRVDGFVAHVASFREIEVFDIRPLENKVTNISFKQCDLMDEKNVGRYAESCESVSCLHVLEHFGLGRYGDPINYDGYLSGFHNIAKMIKQGGRFYFSVPLGIQRIEFHAHRVFSLSYLLEMIMPLYDVESFSYIDQYGDFHPFTELTAENVETNCGCNGLHEIACAVFVLIKK